MGSETGMVLVCKFSTNIIFADFEIACMYALQKLKL